MDKGIFKIIIFMWCRSLQSELLSACILKHVKNDFGGLFGEGPSLQSCCKWKIFILFFKKDSYFLLIKTSKYILS